MDVQENLFLSNFKGPYSKETVEMQEFTKSFESKNIPNLNSLKLVQEIIYYIEEHLLERISPNEIADQFYLSDSSLNTLFSTTTDMTITEYIRNRRLSLAGEELLISQTLIIDLSYKYGYETPEAFTKAFTRFHGISPSQARKTNGCLRMYNPIHFKLTIEGGESSYRIISNTQFSLLSWSKIMHTTFTRKDCINQYKSFWSECIINHSIERLKQITGGTQLYLVKSPLNRNEFKYSIGIPFNTSENESSIDPNEMSCFPEGFELLTLPYTTWAVFPCEGKNEDCIYDTRQMIFDVILPASAFSSCDPADFYVYKQRHEIPDLGEIWIPVKLREDKHASDTKQTICYSKTSDIPTWNHVHLADTKHNDIWNLILVLAKELDASNIPYHFDGKTMIFVHGLEINLNKIGLTFKWTDEKKIKHFFGPNNQTYHYDFMHFKYFDALYHGFPIRCMFYGKSGVQISDETLQANAEPINVDGQIIMAQKLEFYLEFASEEEELYKCVENFVKNRQ